VVPLAYGDSYRGHKVVGTRAPFFELRNRPNDPPYFRLVSGRTFSAPFEAVLGSAAARQLALAPGATFRADHGELAPLPGEEEDDEHAANPYTVVGVLAPTRSPADRGIYVDLESYWRIHEHTGPADRAVTAIAVKGRRFPFDVYRVQQAINAGRLSRDAQAVVAYSELHELNGQIGQAGQALTAVAMVAIGLAGATVFLSLYGAIAERRRVLAVLRALGAGPRRVFALVLIESGLLCALGVVFGTTAGYLGAWLAGQVVYDARAIQVVVGFSPTVLGVVLVGLLLGPLAGLIPAAVAYRQPPDRHLAPT
jgi:putative ABC transport system permease protein